MLSDIEGVVIESRQISETSFLIRLFSTQEGLVTVFQDVSQKIRYPFSNALLNRIFITGNQKNNRTYSFREAKLLQSYSTLFQEKLHSTWSAKLCHFLRSTVWFDQAATPVYQLLLFYLDKWKSFEDPSLLYWSFCLKTLGHEGRFFPRNTCQQCHEPLEKDIYCLSGEIFCSQHVEHKENSLVFSNQEWDQILLLTHTRSITDLALAEVSMELSDKLALLIESMKL